MSDWCNEDGEEIAREAEEAPEEAPEVEQEPEPEPAFTPSPAFVPSGDLHEREPAEGDPDYAEAKKAMEEARAARLAKQLEELAEYQAQRAVEKEQEDAVINALREKRAQRQKEREEESKKLAEMAVQEEARRKAEEADKKAAKEAEEARLKDEREKKKQEAEARLQPKGRNFKITKKSDSEKKGDEPKLDSIMSKDDMQKSKEQLEEEKRAILSQRIQALEIDGLASDKLIEKAKELHAHIRRLEGDKYDLEDKFKRQQYDMIELAERARQMNKGKGKKAVQVDESHDRLADKHTNAPPKIQLCSKYERHTDIRSYGERIDLFEELGKDKPAPEIKRAAAGGEEAEAVEAGGEEE